MATVQSPKSDLRSKLAYYLSHGPHSVWDKFHPAAQQQMVDEDLFAGKSVSLLLFSVISAGLVMAAVSLVIILLAG